jgi:chaperone LolA
MRSVLTSLVLSVLVLASAAVAADAARLRTYLGDLKTFEAAFEQTVEDERGRNLESSFGRFYLSRPGRFRWSYTVPYVQEIVSDGDDVWIYDSELAQVTVKSAREALANAPGLLLSSDRPLESEFTVVDAGRKSDLEWFELTPKSSDAPFRKVRMGFRGRDLTEMELADSFGQLTRLHFKGVIKNPHLNPEVFHFVPPEGVDVMRDTGGAQR